MPGRDIDGVLLLDKPEGFSSNAALQTARRLLDANSAGHTGTLDPMASGLMALCFGEATKFSSGLLDADKAYRARVRLGERTTTGDAEGDVVERRPVHAGREDIEAALARFRGEIEQVPPMHSALKHRGKPLYTYARKGETVERKPRRVLISELVLKEVAGSEFVMHVACSKGTYIRTLAEDIGTALGCGAHLTALRRTYIGPFSIEGAIDLDALAAMSPAEREARLLPLSVLVQSRSRFDLGKENEIPFLHGQAIAAKGCAPGHAAVFGADGRFLGLAEAGEDGLLRPKRLLLQKKGVTSKPL